MPKSAQQNRLTSAINYTQSKGRDCATNPSWPLRLKFLTRQKIFELRGTETEAAIVEINEIPVAFIPMVKIEDRWQLSSIFQSWGFDTSSVGVIDEERWEAFRMALALAKSV